MLSTGAPGGPTGEIIGDWLYAGTQTALPILHKLYSAAARTHFGGTLAGKLVVGGGMGGAGGAQPLAAALNLAPLSSAGRGRTPGAHQAPCQERLL